MIDQRIGIALSDSANTALTDLCAQHDISKGVFVTAMMQCLDLVARDQAIAAYKELAASEREAKLAQRKELKKKLKSLTPEEIENVLAARQAA